MKYFTKEYIKECDCYNIQILKPVIENYEWVAEKKNKKVSKAIRVVASFDEDLDYFVNGKNRANYIWLPTGDNLDEEIVKTMKINYDGKELLDYQAGFEFDEDKYFVAIVGEFSKFQKIENPNPLIAKIKLLKQLIKE